MKYAWDIGSKYIAGLMDAVKPLAPKITEVKEKVYKKAVDGFSRKAK
jgi:hypothetical protein